MLVRIPTLYADACRETSGKKKGVTIYPSLIDHLSTSPNFDTVGQTAMLYVVRYTGESELQRELIRIPVTFTKP